MTELGELMHSSAGILGEHKEINAGEILRETPTKARKKHFQCIEKNIMEKKQHMLQLTYRMPWDI